MQIVRRPVLALNRSPQINLFELSCAKPPLNNPVPERENKRPFKKPDPNEIFISNVRLKDHLKQMDIKEPFIVRQILEELDWKEFEDK